MKDLLDSSPTMWVAAVDSSEIQASLYKDHILISVIHNFFRQIPLGWNFPGLASTQQAFGKNQLMS